MKRLFILSLILLIALCASVYTVSPESHVAFGSFATYAQSKVLNSRAAGDAEKPMKRIRFVGDVMLARNVEHLMNVYGESYPFTLLEENPEDAYLVGNFESSIPRVHKQTPSMQFSFSVKEEFARALATYGFSHMSIANNHSYDFGQDDFEHTKFVLEEASLAPFGDPVGQASSTVQIVEVDGTSVALIGVYAVDVVPTQAVIVSLLSRAETQSDLQIVYVHWGEEYKPVHNLRQENLAHNFIQAGADAVIGHHPHIVQDIELYEGKPIFYSLGNFIFDQYFNEDVQNGLMLELSVADGNLVFDLLPVTSIGARSTARFMSLYEKDVFLEELAEKSDAALAEMIKQKRITLGY